MYKAGELKTKRDYVGEFYYENDTLKFINHEEGRIVYNPEMTNPFDYQYHLKDHLGNTRLTFSTTPESYTYTATMETELATSEEALFQNVAETRVAMALANSTSQDVVPGANKAARIESTDPIGPLAMLQVNKGDTVKLSAYAYYEGDGSTDGLISESALLAALLSGYSGASGISEVSAQTQAALESGLDFPNNLVPKTNETNDDAPKAYINYMQFDADMNLVTSGFKQITTAAQGMKEYVETTPLTIDQNGYVLVYVSNESDELNWVHFDDFAVTHSKTHIVQVDDYYPFGLEFNSFTRSYSEPQRYKYNGKELQEETGWLDYGARMFDASIARWNGKDDFAEGYPALSPYLGMANNPIIFKDVDGNRITLYGDRKLQEQLVSYLERYTGLTLNLSDDGEVTLSGESDGTGSKYLRNLVISLIDPEGEDYGNDVDFYLITGKKKLEGHTSKTFLDNFDAGTLDMDDYQAIADASYALGATSLAHILEERRSTGDYRGLLKRIKEAREKADNNTFKTPEADQKFDNGHLLGNILEGKVATEILDPTGDAENADAATVQVIQHKKTNSIVFTYGKQTFTIVTDKDGNVLRVQ